MRVLLYLAGLKQSLEETFYVIKWNFLSSLALSMASVYSSSVHDCTSSMAAQSRAGQCHAECKTGAESMINRACANRQHERDLLWSG